MLYYNQLVLHWHRNLLLLPVMNLSNKYSTRANSHYESLGVTPKATQAEVKAAYYKQSKIYHPDKNDGSDEAVSKFRAISEAYEVLGNIQLRRLYDKGFLQLRASDKNYTEDPSVNFYRSRRNRPAPPTGRTPIYDFDEWSKSHYGATFAKDMRFRAKQKNETPSERLRFTRKESDNIILGITFSMLFILYIFSPPSNRHDRVVGKPIDQ